MALSNPALPFGLRDVRLYPVNADGSLGAGVDLPASRTFSFTETESFEDLVGDDTTWAAHGSGPTVDWELEAGGMSFEAYKVMAGGTIVTSGVSPLAKKVYSKLTTDSRPYFQVEGQAISDSGGDVHTVVYRCKATGDLEGSFANGAFTLTSAKGKGYGNIIGNNKLYDFIQNETISGIPTIASIALLPSPLAFTRPAVGKLTATATNADATTTDISNVCSWTVSDVTKATVSPGGFVTGLAAGTCTVTATYQGITSPAVTVNIT